MLTMSDVFRAHRAYVLCCLIHLMLTAPDTLAIYSLYVIYSEVGFIWHKPYLTLRPPTECTFLVPIMNWTDADRVNRAYSVYVLCLDARCISYQCWSCLTFCRSEGCTCLFRYLIGLMLTMSDTFTIHSQCVLWYDTQFIQYWPCLCCPPTGRTCFVCLFDAHIQTTSDALPAYSMYVLCSNGRFI